MAHVSRVLLFQSELRCTKCVIISMPLSGPSERPGTLRMCFIEPKTFVHTQRLFQVAVADDRIVATYITHTNT